MKRAGKRTLRLLLVLFVVAAARPVLAAPRAKMSAEDHYEKGMRAYTLGKFPEAIQEFEKAYELRSEPIFLYNIAQSHRNNKDPQRAIFFYRRYLEAEPGAKNRPEIERRISDLEAQMAAKPESTAAVAPPPTPAPLPSAAVVAPVPQPQPATFPPAAVTQAEAAPPASTGRGLRIAGITVGAVGVAGVAAGIFLGLQASSLHDQSITGTFDDDKYQTAKTYRTMEYVALGVGGAALVTGGILYFLGARSKAPPLAVLPSVGPGQGGLVLARSF